MPDDWSYIQIGTTGEYKSRPFQIVGRIRLQLRSEYKNFWCAADHKGDSLWIAESFGSISIFASPMADISLKKFRNSARAQRSKLVRTFH